MKLRIYLDRLLPVAQTPRWRMLRPDHKKNPPETKKARGKKPRAIVRDLPARKDSKGGGFPKSSPESLPIPPQGFIASSDSSSSS